MKRLLLALPAILFILYTAATALTEVRPGERAVVQRFGKILPDKPGPGLHVGWPWGIDRVERVNVARERTVPIGFTGRDSDETATPGGQLLTGDHNLVNVQVDVNYIVADDEIEKFFLHADRAEAVIARAGEAILAEWIAGRTVDQVILRGKSLIKGMLVAELHARLKPYDLGVQITGASVVRLNPPDEVKDAFDRVAQAEIGIKTQINAARQAADRKQRDAEADIFRIERLAATYARTQELQAKVEAENFLKRLEQYRRLSKDNPAYLNALWLDEMTRLFTRMRDMGRLDLLDHYLTGEGLSIMQFPPLPRKK